MLKFRLLLLLLFASSNTLATSFNVPKDDPLEEFNVYAQETIRKWKIPGIAYAIVKDGNIELIKTIGVREVGKPDKINKNTIFRIASLSKAFTATLAAKLHFENKINLNDSLKNYLPNISFANNDYTGSITLAHILSHSSGAEPRCLEKDIQNIDLDEDSIILLTNKIKVENIPGKIYGYQNVLYNFVSKVIAKTQRISFADSMKQEIFKPLNLNDTSIGNEAYINAANKALPHLYLEKKYNYSQDDIFSNYYKVAAAGGINSSIEDMAKWLVAQMGHDPEVISPSVLSLIHREHIRADEFREGWNKNSLLASYYGMGWRIHDYAREKVIHHGGGLNGFATSIVFIPKYNVGIVIISNASSPVPSLLTAKFLDLNLGLPYRDYSGIIYEQRFNSKP